MSLFTGPEWALLIAGAVLAGFVQGVSGFAFGMVSMSVWVWAIDPRLGTVLAVFGGLTGQVLGLFTVRRGWSWPTLWPYLAGALVGVPIGMWLLPRLDVSGFKALLGGLLVVLCPAMLVIDRLPRIGYDKGVGRWADGVVGAIGGFTGAVGGFTGAAASLWGVVRGYDKDLHRGVMQNFNLAALVATVAAHAATGALRPALWPALLLVAAAMLVPAMLGARVYHGMSPTAFRRVVLVLLFATGVVLLASAWRTG